MDCEDSDTARWLGSRLSVNRTRAKILERFYWENVGKDTKEFVLSCDRCQKVNPVHKINVGELHPVLVPSKLNFQLNYSTTQMPKIGTLWGMINLYPEKIDVMIAIRESLISRVASNIRIDQSVQKEQCDRKHEQQYWK
ncbi:Hypothetical predicted protein [Octopus vulgaris]|uniref:Integrase zinc-binding domain-containing protein n=1 Tax=Octopus vulgaris TaxID=6645 RepID=A0AA36FJ05_OCTVU|nr:Hypothetical predicted protein [Octopus vulgaris]